jgi:hypothetical protein
MECGALSPLWYVFKLLPTNYQSGDKAPHSIPEAHTQQLQQLYCTQSKPPTPFDSWKRLQSPELHYVPLASM